METAEIDRLVMKPTARRRLGKYVLLGRLGAGGMGKIYLACAPGPAGIEKLLVVKRLHGHLTGDPVLVNSFLDEARLSMALNHPHIGHTYDVGEVDGRYFMVMEYIEGQNLGVVLRTAKRSGQYPSSAVWGGMFLAVLDGLHAAHVARDARGRPLDVIHRDVSPQNILITYEGLPKLVDFGIAKAAMRVSETDAGVLKGKYAYMSPEQVHGEPLDPRSDVFAAGIVLWEMLAGRRLYKAESIVRSVERIVNEPPISPVRVNPACDPELARVALRALQKDRGQRFSSALEMRDTLDDVLRKVGARVRQADMRDLMHGLFADVIERQRSVLESCLAQEEEAAAAGVAPEARHELETELSLVVPRGAQRPGPGATTPSAAHELVADNDQDAGRSTSVARKRPTAGREALAQQATSATPDPPQPLDPQPLDPQPLDPQPLDLQPHDPRPAEPRRRDRQPATPATGIESRMLADVDITAPHESPPRRSRLWVAAAIAPLAVALLVGLAGTSLLSPTDTKTVVRAEADRVDIQASAPDPSTAPQTNLHAAPPMETPLPSSGQHPSPDEPHATVDVPALAGTGPAAASDLPPARVPPAPPRPRAPDGVGNGAAGRAASTPGEETTPAAATAGPRAMDPRAPPRDEDPASVDAPLSNDTQDGRERKPALPAEVSTLTLDTVPWTTVFLLGRKLGETPLIRVPVPAGTLELVLENPEQNLREPYVVTVKPGQDYKARLDLQ